MRTWGGGEGGESRDLAVVNAESPGVEAWGPKLETPSFGVVDQPWLRDVQGVVLGRGICPSKASPGVLQPQGC